jgi:hypothetical protein
MREILEDKEKRLEHILNSSVQCEYYNAQGGATMKLSNNVNTLLKDDLAEVLKKELNR